MTNFYVWGCFLCIQVSFGNWITEEFWPESLGSMLECWCIEHGLLVVLLRFSRVFWTLLWLIQYQILSFGIKSNSRFEGVKILYLYEGHDNMCLCTWRIIVFEALTVLIVLWAQLMVKEHGGRTWYLPANSSRKISFNRRRSFPVCDR